jgi:hypothetical protein
LTYQSWRDIYQWWVLLQSFTACGQPGRQFVVLSQIILINFQVSFLASTLFTYLRDAIISIKLLIMVIVVIVVVIVFFITIIGNTLSRRTSPGS